MTIQQLFDLVQTPFQITMYSKVKEELANLNYFPVSEVRTDTTVVTTYVCRFLAPNIYVRRESHPELPESFSSVLGIQTIPFQD